jgi:hypothetical protein
VAATATAAELRAADLDHVDPGLAEVAVHLRVAVIGEAPDRDYVDLLTVRRPK